MLQFDPESNQFCNGHAPECDDLAEAVRLMSAQVDVHAAWLRAQHLPNVSPYEAASWALKLAEARRFQASGNADDAPMLGFEASMRGITLADLGARVLSNGAALGGLEALIAGTAGRHRDALKLLATVQDVIDYDWRGGWPA